MGSQHQLCLHAYGAQNCGVSNAYAKAPEMLEKDYKRVIDFCAEHKFNAVGIVALTREKHGGIESARRLCSYAREKGVKVCIIASLYAYGGVCYDGDFFVIVFDKRICSIVICAHYGYRSFGFGCIVEKLTPEKKIYEISGTIIPTRFEFFC